uniref:Uncharacterized protein n=1 Tax=Timema bartmani TaxID=61472 RepID=A0A7R9I2B1_9NEOP|nr:unnamed protein product [Timema bartmani]
MDTKKSPIADPQVKDRVEKKASSTSQTEIDFPIKSEDVFKQEAKQQEENETLPLTFLPIKEEFEVWKQKRLERRHSKKIGRGELFTTSPADDELTAQGLSIQSWNVETDTLWDSNYRHQQNSAAVCALKRPENSSFTSTASSPHIPIPFQTLQSSISNQILPSSTYTSLISISSIPCSSISKEDFLLLPYSSLPSAPSQPQSQSSPRVPESMQHSCCENPTVAPTLQTSPPHTSSTLKVLKRPAKSCGDNLFEVEAILSSKKYNEELKQMWEAHKKKLENENLMHAAHVKLKERLLEHEQQLHLIRLEREKVIQERKNLATEQAKLEKRSAQIDVEMKELDLAIAKSQ